ncbi:hypothetical protein Ddc_15793 [Ditylenchus destructor]|nr:hypothetical protein Ddc_15793 [Ditylenchus destructor]
MGDYWQNFSQLGKFAYTAVFPLRGFCRVGVLACEAWASSVFRQNQGEDLALFSRVPRVLSVKCCDCLLCTGRVERAIGSSDWQRKREQ